MTTVAMVAPSPPSSPELLPLVSVLLAAVGAAVVGAVIEFPGAKEGGGVVGEPDTTAPDCTV